MTHPSDQATLHPTYGLQTTVTPTERGASIPQYRTPLSLGGKQRLIAGAGSPEAVVTASPGVTYEDITNGTLYVKNTGVGNTGWLLVLLLPASPTALTQTYSTADATLSAYTPNAQSSAYTGAADSEAKLSDLNLLRVAYENLRAFTEDLAKFVNSAVDALQAEGLVG